MTAADAADAMDAMDATADADAAAPAGAGAMADPGADAAVGARGRTMIADRVVERIATRAATESGPVTGPGGLPGLRGPAVRPRVSANVRGRVATVRVALGVTYPSPIRTITRHVRERIQTRVHDLTGIDVRQVDIAVARLPEAREERRVR